ncbi:MAG TPA: hypoxanthine phosphoribosyltransferase [Deltaproteobacteria bacterium]|nr:hypoxanthine phosphoribosyltransferase [Deltaproteobacteria bacterium]
MPDSLKILFTHADIEQVIQRLARSIRQDFGQEEIVFVCVLKGSFIFTADLVRAVANPSVVDFIRISSYRNGMTHGNVAITKDLETDIQGKNVVIVEDIIDSGITLTSLRNMLLTRKPKALKICALIDKRARREVQIEGDYVGFSIDKGFVVGYGIDYAEKYRNLRDIFVVEEGE